MACSAALATLAIFENDNVLEKNREKSALIQAKMQVLDDLPIEHLRHQGMIFAFDVITKNPQFSKRFYRAAIKQGVLLRPIGNTVYFMPPYTIASSEIDFMLQATVKALQETL